jgi:hypothetical protein
MTGPAPFETTNLDRYGDAELEWSRARDALTAPFSAPSAGPPPWQVYRFTFHTVVGVASQEPYGATRWRFQR